MSSRQKFSARSAVAEKSKPGKSKPEETDFVSSNDSERVAELSHQNTSTLANEISPEKSVESPTLGKVHHFKKLPPNFDVDSPSVEPENIESLIVEFSPIDEAENNSSNMLIAQDVVPKQMPAQNKFKDENLKPKVRDFTTANRENLIGQLVSEFNEELKNRTGEELNFLQREGLERLYRIQDKNPRTDKQLFELDVLQKKFDVPLPKPKTSLEGEVIKFDNSSDVQKLETLRRRLNYVDKNIENAVGQKENAAVPIAPSEKQTSVVQAKLADYKNEKTSSTEIVLLTDGKIVLENEKNLVAQPVEPVRQAREVTDDKSASSSIISPLVPAAEAEQKDAVQPASTFPKHKRHLFITQITALRGKNLSTYWWKMKTETDERGCTTLNPAAFEHLRVVYKQTFQKDIKNFDNAFNESGVADKFLQTLDMYENKSGIYSDSIASINQSILQGRQIRGDGTLELITDEKPVLRDASDSFSNLDKLNDREQNDRIYAELNSIFEQAGIEKILGAEKLSASFQTVGSRPAKFELTVEDGEISFGEITAAGNSNGQNTPVEKIRGITFAAGSAGNYQYTGGFTRDLKDGSGNNDFDKAEAFDLVTAWKNDGLGENIIITKVAADDDDLTTGIEAANTANAEKYLSRQKGFELIGEIAVRTAAFDAAEFRRTGAEQKLAITATVAGQEVTREVSQNELLRERQALARFDVAAAKKTGILGMISDDENKPLEAVEKRYYAKALIKAEEKQKPLIEALDETIGKEALKLDKLTEAAKPASRKKKRKQR